MRSLRRAGLRLIAGQPRGGGEPAPQIRHDYGLGTIMGRAYLAGGRTTGRTPTTVPGSPPAGADRRRALAVPGRRCRRRPARLRHLRHLARLRRLRRFLLLSAGGGLLPPGSRIKVETLRPVERKHAQRRFSFHRTQNFRVVRSFHAVRNFGSVRSPVA